MHIPSQFPAFLIAMYWHEVEELLVNTHGVGRDGAKAGIKNYRRAMRSVGDILYHKDEKDVAEAIVRAGYLPKPAPAPTTTP